jgi:putative addiction module antidote
MVQLKVRKVGNSLGLTLPAEAAKALRVREGDQIFLTEAPGGCFRITPYDPDFADAMEAAESFMTRYRNALRELAK